MPLPPLIFETNVDFAKVDLLNVVIQPTGAEPPSPTGGQIWFDTANQTYKFYAFGVGWSNMSANSAQINFGGLTSSQAVNKQYVLGSGSALGPSGIGIVNANRFGGNATIQKSQGGTGRSAFGSGHILFGDASSTQVGLSDNFIWDTNNNRLGLGGAIAPSATLHIQSSTGHPHIYLQPRTIFGTGTYVKDSIEYDGSGLYYTDTSGTRRLLGHTDMDLTVFNGTLPIGRGGTNTTTFGTGSQWHPVFVASGEDALSAIVDQPSGATTSLMQINEVGIPTLVYATGNTSGYFVVHDGSGFRLRQTSLNLLSDFNTSGSISGHFLKYNGSNWTNVTLATGDLPATVLYSDKTQAVSGATRFAPNTFGIFSANGGVSNINSNASSNASLVIEDIGAGRFVLEVGGGAWTENKFLQASSTSGGVNLVDIDISDLSDVSVTGAASGQSLIYNGSLWTTGVITGGASSGTPSAGSFWSIQYNNSGEFGGDSDFLWDYASDVLVIGHTDTLGTDASNGNIEVLGQELTKFPGFAATYASTTYAAVIGPTNLFNKARGTLASPSNVANGDILGFMNFAGYSSGTFRGATSIKSTVNGTAGGAVLPGKLSFLVSTHDYNSLSEVVNINSSGDLTVGSGNIVLGNDKRAIFLEGDGKGGSHYISFEAPELTGYCHYIFPEDYGTSGHKLTTDGAGNLFWTAAGGSSSLSSLSDVSLSSVASGEVLMYNGSAWENVPQIPPHFTSSEFDTGRDWIDGSRVYGRVLQYGAMPNTTQKSSGHGVTGIASIVKIEGITTNGTITFPLPYVNVDSLSNGIALWADSTDIHTKTGTNRSTFTNSQIYFYYTKS